MKQLTRRSLLKVLGITPAAAAFASGGKIPVGLELYSVRDDLKRDPIGTVRAVGKLGYQCVEFYAPYYDWTPDYAREMRKVLDDAGLRCYSTHNSTKSFTSEGMPHAIELNKILGSTYIVMAHPGTVEGLSGWQKVAETLTAASERFKSDGLRAGYHNHLDEWKPIDGRLPLEVIAKGTPDQVALQFDLGPCLESGHDPVAWINQNPGRIKSMHLKDWSPRADQGYKVLFGEGIAQWKPIFHAAEKTGGVEYYLIEQEGSTYPPMETAERCLRSFHQLHG